MALPTGVVASGSESLNDALVWFDAANISGEEMPFTIPNRGKSGAGLDIRTGSTALSGRAYVQGNTLNLPGIDGNYAVVPDANYLDITGDIEIVVRARCSGAPTASRGLVVKNNAYRLLNGNGDFSVLWFAYWNGSSWTGLFSNTGLVLADTTRWYKVTRTQSTGLISFFYAEDQPTEPSSWTAAGATVVSAGVAMPASTFNVEIGSRDTGLGVWNGKIHRALIRNSIGGTAVMDVNFAQPDWVTYFKESSSNNAVVTINSTGSAVDPKFLPYSGRKYIYTTGAVGSGAWSTPTHPTVTEVDIRVNVTNAVATSDDLMTVGYRGGFAAFLMTDTALSFMVRSTDVTTPNRYPGSTPYNPKTNLYSWLAVTFNPTTRAFAFYGYAANVANPPSSLSSWVTIGSGTASSGTSAGQWEGNLDSTGSVYQWVDIMANNKGGGGNIEGRFYGYQTRSTINGTIVDSLTCANAVSSSRTFAGDGPAGGTVTVVAPSTGAKTTIVTRPLVLFRKTDYLEIPADPYGAYATFPGTPGAYISAPDSNALDILGTEGTRFLTLPREANFSFARVPNAANLQIVGDLELVCRVSLDDWNATYSQILMSKGYAGEWYWLVSQTSVGLFSVITGTNRSAAVTWNTGRPANGGNIWLKVTKVAATGLCTFFYAADQTTEPSSWTTIGSASFPVTGNSDTSTFDVGFGAGVQSTTYVGGERMKGKFFRGIVRSVIGGSAVLDADFTAQPIGTTTFTATTGQTVTLGGTTNPTNIVDGTTYYYSSGLAGSLASAPSTTSLNISGSQATGFLSLPGIAGNGATIPHAAAFSILGDIECVARVALDDWTPAINNGIMERDNADGNRHFHFLVTTGGRLRFRWFPFGVSATGIIVDSTVPGTWVDGTTYWVKATLDVDNGASGYDVKFWYAADQTTEPSSWTQLGTTVTGAGVTTLWAATSTFNMAGGNASGAFAGRIYRTILRNGIGGTTVMDANFTLPALGATSFTATAGGTVTVNGTNAKIVDGATYLYAPGISGSIATAPNSAALQLVGDRTFTADVALAKWNPTSGDQYRYFISKRVGGTGEYFFRTDPNTTPRGCLQLVWYESGVSKAATSTTNPVAADGTRLQVAVTHDVDNGAGGNDVRFFTRANDSAPWVQLGSTITSSGIAAPTATTTGVAFGAEGPGGLQETAFKYYRVTAANGIGAAGVPGGTIVLDARFDRQLQYASSFVEASSNAATVSMSGGAVIQRNRDIEIVTRAMLEDWTPTTRQTLIAKYNEGSAQRSYALSVNNTGELLFQWSTNGAAAGSAEQGSSAPSLVDGTTYWLRATLDVDNGSGGSTVTFYKANDQETEPTSWTTVSTHTITGGIAIFPGTSTLSVGQTSDSLRPTIGKIYRAIVRNKAIPSTVFDADFTRQIQFASTFIEGSANGATVTMSGLGARIERQRDLEIVARVMLTDWSPATTQTIVGKWTTTGNQRSYQLAQLGTTLTLMCSSDGGNNGASEQAGANFGAAVDGTTYWVKATRSAATGLVTLSYAADQATEPSVWTSLGTPTMTFKGGPFPSTGIVEIGSVAAGSTFNLDGRVYRVIVRNGINGARVADHNVHGFPLNSNVQTDEQGNVWTRTGGVTFVNLNPLNMGASDSFTFFFAGRVWSTVDGPYMGKGNDFFSTNFLGWCSYVGNRTRTGTYGAVLTNTNGSAPASGVAAHQMHVVNTSNLFHFLGGAANGASVARSTAELGNPFPFVVGKRGNNSSYSDFELLAFGVWKRELNANEAATLVARYA